MTNRYKIDCHFEYDRVDRPYGVYVRVYRLFPRWKYICAFKTDAEAQAYVCDLIALPREIYKVA